MQEEGTAIFPFLCWLFNNVVSIDTTVYIIGWWNDWSIIKDLESDYSLMEVLPHVFAWRDWGKPQKKTQSDSQCPGWFLIQVPPNTSLKC
jgi:hypothetical protein